MRVFGGVFVWVCFVVSAKLFRLLLLLLLGAVALCAVFRPSHRLSRHQTSSTVFGCVLCMLWCSCLLLRLLLLLLLCVCGVDCNMLRTGYLYTYKYYIRS